jgi:hypothetical protein
MRMAWHAILFDRDEQTSAAENTYEGTNTYHGVVVIRGDMAFFEGTRAKV